MEVEYRDTRPSLTDAVEIYRSVSWMHYVEDTARLERAFDASPVFVSALLEQRCVGFLRALTDGETILYVQDIVVRPEHHRKGIGKGLVDRCLKRYERVRQRVLLTDDRPEQRAFYEALGFSNTGSLRVHKLNAFVQFRGMTLE